MQEIWKPVPYKEFADFYEVSNFSNIRVAKRRKGVYLKENALIKPKKAKDGYLLARFSLNGKQYYKAWHRVVALAFLPNPDNKLEINHKDCDKSNNKLSNLEWVTPKENQAHAVMLKGQWRKGRNNCRPIKNMFHLPSGITATKKGKAEYMKLYRKKYKIKSLN